MTDTPSLQATDLNARLGADVDYKSSLQALQLELLKIQHSFKDSQRSAIIAFEGWDAAGKGGVIRRLTEKLDPREIRVHAIGAPSQEEVGRHFLRRFWLRLPRPGQIGIFDRSWYGRVLVERVEGFCSEADWQRGYREIREFEQTLVDNGTVLIKLFLHISFQEQLRRFQARLDNPFKHWKLTEDDLRNAAKRGDYERALSDMFERTHTDAAPWRSISCECKHHGRIASLRYIEGGLRRDQTIHERVLSKDQKRAFQAHLETLRRLA